jgi:hypothetical protein
MSVLNFPLNDIRAQNHAQSLHIEVEARWKKFLDKTAAVTAATAEMNEAHMAYIAAGKELEMAMATMEKVSG